MQFVVLTLGQFSIRLVIIPFSCPNRLLFSAGDPRIRGVHCRWWGGGGGAKYFCFSSPVSFVSDRSGTMVYLSRESDYFCEVCGIWIAPIVLMSTCLYVSLIFFDIAQ